MIHPQVQDNLRNLPSKKLIELRGEFHAKVKRCKGGYLSHMAELCEEFERYCDIELKARWSITA